VIRFEEILAAKRAEIDQLKRTIPLSALEEKSKHSSPPRNFSAALRVEKIAIIAEIKRSSPSQGTLTGDFDHRAIAREYEQGGAAALSVLTDRKFFQGDPSFIAEVRDVSTLPVLRKDFILDEYQVFESRAIHADAILLIARALNKSNLKRLYNLAQSLGLAVLLEVHDEHDLAVANEMEAEIIGINNRDFSDYSVSLERSLKLRAAVHTNAIVISESGIRTGSDVARLALAKFHGVLIGESLMRMGNKIEALKSLVKN